MGYVPAGTKWWLAELVEEITVEGDPRNVIHRNWVLVRADSAEEAYESALNLGRESEQSYTNPNDKQVNIRYRGLAELSPICDELAHGAELTYIQQVGVPEDEVQKLLKKKEELDVFVPWKMPKKGEAPDYACKEILEEVEREFGIPRPAFEE